MKKAILYILCLGLTLSSLAQTSKDSLFKLPDTEDKINSLIEVAKSSFSSNSEESIRFSKEAIRIAKKIGNKSQLAVAYNTAGVAYDYAVNQVVAIKYIDSSIVVYKAINDKEGHGRALNDKGISYYYSGDLDKATKFYLQAIPLHKEIKYNKGIASALNNLGIIARSEGKFNQALDYYKESIYYKEQLNDSLGLAATYRNIASIYQSLEDWQEALKYNLLSKTHFKNYNEAEYYAAALNISICYKNLDQLENAEDVLLEAYPKLKEFGEARYLATYHVNLGGVYFDLLRFKDAEFQLLEAVKYAEKVNNVEVQLIALLSLGEVYSKLNEYKLAFEYMARYETLRKEVNYQNKSEDIQELEAKFNYQQQKEEINLLNEQAENDKLRIENARWFTYVLIGGIIIAILILLFAFIYARKLQKQKNIANRALADRELLLKEIHHRVKNNLQLVSSLLYLQSDHIDDENALKAIEVSRTRVEAMAIIHQKLYGEDNLIGVSTGEYIDELIDGIFETLNIDEDDIQIQKDIDDIYLDIDTTIPLGLIMNELITNSLKHAFPEGQEDKQVEIKLKLENDTLILEVNDNGLGNIVSAKNSSGFGSRMIDMFCKKLDGEMHSVKENGYRVSIRMKNFKLQ